MRFPEKEKIGDGEHKKMWMKDEVGVDEWVVKLDKCEKESESTILSVKKEDIANAIRIFPTWHSLWSFPYVEASMLLDKLDGTSKVRKCNTKSMIEDSEGMRRERLEKGRKDAVQLLKKAIVLMYNEWADLKELPSKHKPFGVCLDINKYLDEGKGEEFIERTFPVGEAELEELKVSIEKRKFVLAYHGHLEANQRVRALKKDGDKWCRDACNGTVGEKREGDMWQVNFEDGTSKSVKRDSIIVPDHPGTYSWAKAKLFKERCIKYLDEMLSKVNASP